MFVHVNSLQRKPISCRIMLQQITRGENLNIKPRRGLGWISLRVVRPGITQLERLNAWAKPDVHLICGECGESK
jgi:hypothetical protein